MTATHRTSIARNILC